MKYLSISILVSFLCLQAQGQADLSYYLPQDVTYNKNIPTPGIHCEIFQNLWTVLLFDEDMKDAGYITGNEVVRDYSFVTDIPEKWHYQFKERHK